MEVCIFHLHLLHLSWWFRWWAWPCRPDVQWCAFRRSASHTFWYCFAQRTLRLLLVDSGTALMGGSSIFILAFQTCSHNNNSPLAPRFSWNGKSLRHRKIQLKFLGHNRKEITLNIKRRNQVEQKKKHSDTSHSLPTSPPPDQKTLQNFHHSERDKESSHEKPV